MYSIRNARKKYVYYLDIYQTGLNVHYVFHLHSAEIDNFDCTRGYMGNCQPLLSEEWQFPMLPSRAINIYIILGLYTRWLQERVTFENFNPRKPLST